MKKPLIVMTLVMTLLLSFTMGGQAAAQKPHVPPKGTVTDSTDQDGIEVFSDTTTTDSSVVSTSGTVYGTSGYTRSYHIQADSFSGFMQAVFSSLDNEGMAGMLFALFVVVFIFVLLPLLILIALLYLIVNNRRQKRRLAEMAMQRNETNKTTTSTETTKDNMTTKRLLRSNDRVLGGVCAGLAEYMDFDPVLVRLGYAALTLFTAFAGIPFYILAWIIIPAKNPY